MDAQTIIKNYPSDDAAAKALGLSRSTVSRLRRGKMRVGWKSADAILKAHIAALRRRKRS